MMKDKQTIKTIIDLFESSDVAKMELELEGFKIKLEKAQPVLVHPPQSFSTPPSYVPPTVSAHESHEVLETTPLCHEIKAPLVGTFYQSSSPNSDPFVKVGDIIKKGQVVCVIEAMKVMNEVTSSINGKVIEICVNNNASVAFNQVLFKVEAYD